MSSMCSLQTHLTVKRCMISNFKTWLLELAPGYYSKCQHKSYSVIDTDVALTLFPHTLCISVLRAEFWYNDWLQNASSLETVQKFWKLYIWSWNCYAQTFQCNGYRWPSGKLSPLLICSCLLRLIMCGIWFILVTPAYSGQSIEVRDLEFKLEDAVALSYPLQKCAVAAKVQRLLARLVVHRSCPCSSIYFSQHRSEVPVLFK